MPSIKRCNLKQLVPQSKSETSTGITTEESFLFSKRNGRQIEIKKPFDDSVMSESSLLFRTDRYGISSKGLLELIKCFLILQSLPEPALEEAADELEGIAEFYSNRTPQATQSILPPKIIKGKLQSKQVRPTIVLEP